MFAKRVAQVGLLLSSMTAYGQTTPAPIINEASLQLLHDQVCECLTAKSRQHVASDEAIRTCFEEEFEENGAKLIADNNLVASVEIGQQIGLLLSKKLLVTCPAFRAIRTELPDQQVVNQAEALREAGKYGEALAAFNRLMNNKLLLIDWTVYNERGLCRLELGDVYGALADFEYAVQRDSTAAMAQNNRGMAKNQLGDKQGAFDDFSEAIRLDSAQALFFENRGVLLYNDEQYDRARADLLKAVALNPTSAGSYYYLGQCGKAEADYSATTAGYFTKAIELAPTNHEYRNARGLFYDSKKDRALARADYLTAIRLSPDYNPAYYNLAQIELADNKPADALKHLNAAIRLDSTYDIYFDRKAEALLRLKRYKEALLTNEQALALAPKKADLYDTRASIEEAAGNTQQAIDAYTKSLELYDRDGAIYYRRGLAKLKLRDKQGACDDFQWGTLFKNADAANALKTNCR